jgi:hypothetical protein
LGKSEFDQRTPFPSFFEFSSTPEYQGLPSFNWSETHRAGHQHLGKHEVTYGIRVDFP